MSESVKFSVSVRRAQDEVAAYVRAFSSEYPLGKWRIEARTDALSMVASRTASAIWRSQSDAIKAAWDTGTEDWAKLIAIPPAISLDKRRGYTVVSFTVDVKF